MQPSSTGRLLFGHPLGKPGRPETFRTALLAWYDECKRDLPWRSSPSLYKTVVSEFMLQQTRVSTVLPYFERWMKLFPDFGTLARAKEERVLKAWEGLGYYSRARNLRKLAKEVASWEIIPEDAKSWQRLPGVGPYVAAAVTSISFGSPEAVCDGNVARVLGRLFAVDELFRDGATAQKRLRPLAGQLLDRDRPGDYNQAMMELGAIVCRRQSPLCPACPVRADCEGTKTDDVERYPNLARRKKTRKKLRRYWIESDKGLLLHCPPAESLRLAGIFELPGKLPASLKGLADKAKPLVTRKRTIGQVDYEEEIFRTDQVSSVEHGHALPKGYRWVSSSGLDAVTLSGPHRKWIEEIGKKAQFGRAKTS